MSKGLARMDLGLFIALLVMLGLGLVLVYSSSFALAQQRFGGSEFFFSRQMVRALMALAGFMVFINVDYHWWGKLSNLGYIVAIVLLITVLLLPAGSEINGAKRWLGIGPFQVQVSDVARLMLILFIARHCDSAGADVKQFPFFCRMIGMIALACFLVLLEPSFSTSSIILLICLSMLFMAGTRITHLGALGVSMALTFVLVASRMPHFILRWKEFIHRQGNFENMGYQAAQSIIGIGNGGLFGVGIGKGEQKFFYLPEPHTDFVVSILGEEIGFVGLMIIFAAYAFIVYRGMKIASQAPDKMGQLMAFGFTFTIAAYMLLHTSVAVGLLPTTGVALPFISYGGMSLIFMLCSMGIVLNISSQSRYGMVAEKDTRRGRRALTGKGRPAFR
jgi:cell division protein FtsW